MRVLTICSTKGGVGKSTLATNLAVAAVKKYLEVVIVDTDVQGTCTIFRGLRESDDIPVVQVVTATSHRDLERLFRSMDLVIIDAGGRDNPTLRSAMVSADMILIPCLPSIIDYKAVGTTVDIAKTITENSSTSVHMVLNQAAEGTHLKRDADKGLAEYKDTAPLLDTKIHSRVVYRHALEEGKGVLEYEPKGKAAKEIMSLFEELMGHGLLQKKADNV